MNKVGAFLCAFALWCSTANSALAEQPIQFARTPDISPDGQTVTFSYLGDIWTVPAIGGVARPITMHPAHEFEPVFSPDGKKLAFSSNRHGQYDVFVVASHGGKPTRLTFHSKDDHVCDWSPDGKYILFQSSRSIDYPFYEELFRIPASGGRVERVTHFGGKQGSISPDGREIAYVKGPGAWYRQGYRGSANDEIWICLADGTKHRALTKFSGQDNYPVWSADQKSLYWVTDSMGKRANIVRQELASGTGEPLAVKSKPEQITHHESDTVRHMRLSRNGDWLVYECGPDLYIKSTKAGPARKMLIEAYADNKENPNQLKKYTSGASEFAVSPNEKYIAFVVHGEIFLIPRGGGAAKRLTDHPANDHGLAWSPDSKRLLFISDRDSQEDIYEVVSDDVKHPYLIEAHRFKVSRITNTVEAEMGMMFSPDGKRISFLREGKLMSMNALGADEKIIVDEQMVIDYDWSPDSKWICYSRMDGSYASEMYIVPSTGPTAANPGRNVTRYATYNAHVTWSKQNHRIAFLSERGLDAQRNIYVMSLQKPAAKGTPSSNQFDWEDIHLRVQQPTSRVASRLAISPNGTQVAFRADDELWVANTSGTSVKRISSGELKPNHITWSQLLPHLIYFRSGNGTIYYGFANGKDDPLRIPFLATMHINQTEEFDQIFQQSWHILNEYFYDPKYHGVDWRAVHDKYRPLVKHIAMREDLDDLINLMMGELNASHMGIQEPPSSRSTPDESTAYLGLVFDESYKGPGLQIKEVVARGPADRKGLNLKPGHLVMKIDHQEIQPDTNLAALLNGKSGYTLTLEVIANPLQPKDRHTVEVKAVSRTSITPLMYQRWVKQKARQVAAISKKKLGYIHIPRMDDSGLDAFLRSLYSDNNDKDALVLDVRFNSGGFTHDKILTFLGGKVHTLYYHRHGTMGTVFKHADRKWNKPMILLINSKSFSSTEVFARAFHALELGKIVGTPTGGHVIGTSTKTLIDGSKLRIPLIGVFTPGGVNLEKKGMEPDLYIENHPDELANGVDTQLQRAIELLLREVAKADAKPKNSPPVP